MLRLEAMAKIPSASVLILGALARKARRARPNSKSINEPPTKFTALIMVACSSVMGSSGAGVLVLERICTKVESCTIQSARLSISGTLLATKSAEPLTTKRAGSLVRRWVEGSSSDVSIPGRLGSGMPVSANMLSQVPTIDTKTGQRPPASSPSNSWLKARGATVGMSTIRVDDTEVLASTVSSTVSGAARSKELA